MTVGLPGTGIGGMFYLLSALAMPLREARRRTQDGPAGGRWRVVAAQTAIAGGIIASMWVTGWLLGIALSAVHPVVKLAGPPHGNVLRTAALVLSLGTLAAVLCGVELLRLWVHGRSDREVPVAQRELRAPQAARPARQRVAAAGGRARTLVTLILLEAVAAADPRSASPQSGAPPPPPPVAVALARADSAFVAGSASIAARRYEAVLAAHPDNSRAVYRLAQLSQADPAEALRLFRRYMALEPTDPWGYMAVGDVLARSGRSDAALEWYDQAVSLAPGERDAVVGRARVLARARRTDAAIAQYERWLAAHPTDAEAWRELGRERLRAGLSGDAAQAFERAAGLVPDPATARRLALARAAAAPAFTPQVSGSHDSDGNTTLRLGGAAELAVTGPWRLGVTAGRERVGDGVTTTTLTDGSVQATWRPRAVLQIDAAAGATRLDAAPAAAAGTPKPPPGPFGPSAPNGPNSESATLTATGQLRARWRAPAGGPALDLRAQRSVLDASPLLVQNRITRTELRGILELPLPFSVAPALKLRGIARTAALSDSNHRTTLAGMVAVAATPSVELSGQFHAIRYDRPDTVGYFAPRLTQIVQAGSYVEFETPQGALFAFDLGAGVQRVAPFGAAIGPWQRALSLYSLILVPLAPGRDLKFELDLEDSPLASEAATSGQWRYASGVVSLRWALP